MKTSTKFEKTLSYILGLWMLLPILAIIKGFITALTTDSELQLGFLRMSNYQNIFFYAGTLTILYLLFRLAKISSSLHLNVAIVKDFFKKNIWILFFLLLLLWILLSALQSPSVMLAFSGAMYRNMGVFTYVVFGCLMLCGFCVKTEKSKVTLMHLFILVADLVAVLMLIQEADLPLINKGFGMLRSSVFLHFNHLGYYFNLATICVSGLLIYDISESKKAKSFELCSLVFIFYTLLINNTMGGILASLITSGVILWFYYIKNHKFTSKQFLPIIIILFLILLSCFGLLPSSSGEDMSDNFLSLYSDANKLAEQEDVGSIGTLRFSLWAYYGKMIPDHPFFGLGPDQEPVGYEEHVISDRPANEYLYHAVFHGLPALIFYLAFLITLAVHQFKHIKELSPVTLIAAGCVVAYCISAFFGNAIYYTACYLFIFIGFILPENMGSDFKV